MRKDEPQIVGTPYITIKNETGEIIKTQYKINSTKVMDEERQYYYVPALTEQK